MRKADYVMRIAQHRYDAIEDPDYRMVYSSTNSSLPIVKQGEFVVTDTGGAKSIIFEHNLGFIPMFLIHRKVDNNTRLEFANDDLLQIRANRKELYTLGGDLTEIMFTILNINLELPYDSGSEFVGALANVEGEETDAYSLKVAKDRRNIDSPDLRDFTVNTEARNPMVHKIVLFNKGAAVSNPVIAVDHELGYAPIPLAYGTSPSLDSTEDYQFYQIGPVSGFGTQLKSNSKQVIMTDSSSATKKGALVILTDPILLS